MKIIALNFGREGQKTESYLMAAVDAAKASGAEVELIEMSDKNIGRCRGCGICSDGLRDLKTDLPMCIFQDDLQAIGQKWLDADGVIIASPTYILAPPGQFFDFVHRFAVCADAAVMRLRRYQREKNGQRPIEPRLIKRRCIGLISVSGYNDRGWSSLGLPGLNTAAFSSNMKVVGGVNVFDESSDERKNMFMGQCGLLGAALASAIAEPDKPTQWVGEAGHCPVCHGDIFTVKPGTTKLECPICGMTGKLSVLDDEPVVTFSDDAIEHSRMNLGGIIDHCVELHGDEEYCMELYGDATTARPTNFGSVFGPIMEEMKKL